MRGNLVIIIPFALIGGLMAGINTYREMQRHVGRERAIRMAVRTGVEAFLVLTLVSVIAALTIPYIVRWRE
ncbi:MAG: hypothetical protein KKI08_21580 [Armatimonadetes bacterium]|nr:hypothetical protein [Armatimonadota bacterium]